MTTETTPTIGFIGLGVMGGPMCRNVAVKHDGDVIAFDMADAAFESIADTKASRAASIPELAEQADIVFLSLPGGPQVESVCLGKAGLASANPPPSIIIDLSTTSVASARTTASKLTELGITFVDAPVARTREAAQRGELSIMVGSDSDTFAQIKPYLLYMASDVTHGGDIGCGQVLKLTNNALVFENTLALAEMMVVAERAGVAPSTFMEAISKGSGDSFALRNHGMKALLPREFPEKAFPPEYVVKDFSYILELAEQTGVNSRVAKLAERYYATAAKSGWSGRYFPCVIEIIDQDVDLSE